jgi:hypothetical protein
VLQADNVTLKLWTPLLEGPKHDYKRVIIGTLPLPEGRVVKSLMAGYHVYLLRTGG